MRAGALPAIPDPGQLLGDAGAVGFSDGFTDNNSQLRTLIVHWDGTSWTQVPSPSAGELFGVLGIGWAVGGLGNGTLIEHWDGRTWSVVPGADLRPGAVGRLAAVSAASPTSIWAVGTVQASEDGPRQMLIEHYDGARWTQAARPGPGSLRGVSVTGASDAWAVGQGTSNSAAIVHYDGTSWVPVPTNTSFSINLGAVSASSPASVWAVGLGPVGTSRALHLRCC